MLQHGDRHTWRSCDPGKKGGFVRVRTSAHFVSLDSSAVPDNVHKMLTREALCWAFAKFFHQEQLKPNFTRLCKGRSGRKVSTTVEQGCWRAVPSSVCEKATCQRADMTPVSSNLESTLEVEHLCILLRHPKFSQHSWCRK